MTGILVSGILPSRILYAVIGIPTVIAALVAVSKVNKMWDREEGFSSVTGSSSNEFYDTAIEPEEAWQYVNDRIHELNESGNIHPYRKIEVDRSNTRHNRKIRQTTIKAKIDGRRTRATILIGRPQTENKFQEMIGYLIDLKNPSIEDYKGNIREGEARRKMSEWKEQYYFEEGGDSELPDDKSKKGSPYVQINDSSGKEER